MPLPGVVDNADYLTLGCKNVHTMMTNAGEEDVAAMAGQCTGHIVGRLAVEAYLPEYQAFQNHCQ